MGKQRTELDVLFPKKVIKVDMGEGADPLEITVKPVSLKHLPDVLDSLNSLIQAAEKDSNPTALVTNCLAELVKILPFCIDKSMDEIPAAIALPDLAEAIVELNINDQVVAKWQALSQKVLQFAGRGGSQG